MACMQTKTLEIPKCVLHGGLLNKMSADGSTTGMYLLKIKVSHAV